MNRTGAIHRTGAVLCFGDPGVSRTRDFPFRKRALYPLSYGIRPFGRRPKRSGAYSMESAASAAPTPTSPNPRTTASSSGIPPLKTNLVPLPFRRARDAARARPHSPAPRTNRAQHLRRWIRSCSWLRQLLQFRHRLIKIGASGFRVGHFGVRIATHKGAENPAAHTEAGSPSFKFTALERSGLCLYNS